MDKKFNRKNNAFKICLIIFSLIFNVLIGFLSKSFKINLIILVFNLIIIFMFFIYERMFHNYMKDILIKLSDMLATISDMRKTEVFSMIDDSLFSKLQHQTLRLTNILKTQNSKIEEDKNEIKSLISDIAHQLKTPLTNMKMYSEFLQDEDLTKKERQEFNEIILLSLDKLCFLVENMIKMSRLESSVISINQKYEDLNDTILMAITQLHKKAEMKNIHIDFRQKDKVNLYHDKKWTCEAIFNIIENAIKYSKENSKINIAIQKYEMFTRIDIEDHGIGIKEEEIPKIFSRFYRGQNVQDKEGIGIGLYLSRQIITKQDGYIKVKSQDTGSTFSIFMLNDIKNKI
ncbi:HAMP domain-containing histidine kinase [Terrisporobacter petrolearius]|uniref:sensor histidine kinase n=1 Tax=Terrisporobacter petrolearius TaxID=1460447 RepID=UPI001D16AB8F|nr:HAMP domain-containing sensor histidine kinase [Terrisporobacter petrolearius]MCC3865917.1 HAMP domain-containing histidine kinase [Terrisporobacter petrolearius]